MTVFFTYINFFGNEAIRTSAGDLKIGHVLVCDEESKLFYHVPANCSFDKSEPMSSVPLFGMKIKSIKC